MSGSREKQTAWQPDVLDGYWRCTLPLGPDPDGEGEVVATLIRKGAGNDTTSSAGRAVLAVHGYTDYFFNTELADAFTARGFAFYALDLRKLASACISAPSIGTSSSGTRPRSGGGGVCKCAVISA